jgi:hypothetical protein
LEQLPSTKGSDAQIVARLLGHCLLFPCGVPCAHLVGLGWAREELREHLWPAFSAHDEDRALRVSVRAQYLLLYQV